MNGTIVGHGSYGHEGISYQIRITRLGHVITRAKRHIKTSQIMAEEYLRKEVLKKSTSQVNENLKNL